MPIIRPSKRGAFTLIEMLVVIAIIAVLAGLTTAAVLMVMGGQRNSNTGTMMNAVQKILDQHFKAVVDKAGKETIPATVISMANGDPRRARLILKKLRLRQEFPQSYAEALNPAAGGGAFVTGAVLPAKNVYVQAFNGQAGSPEVQNSSCLLLALQQNRRGISLNPDDFKSNVGDTNGDSIKELIDSWGNPMVFFRFPTGNAELNKLNPALAGSRSARFQDPMDPDGLLMDPSWNNYANWNFANSPIQVFELLCHPIHVGGTAATYQPVSNYILPTLVSAGKDGKMGLNADMSPDASVPPDSDDNIFSFRLRSGAGGLKQ